MTTREYIPAEYWEQRGATCPTDGSALGVLGASLVKIIGDYSKPGDTFLEIGSGWGRILLHLEEQGVVDRARYSMCDIAQASIDRCTEATGLTPDWWDGVTLPYDDGAFDWVISFSVLLHVPPADLQRHVGELLRVARRYVFVSSYSGNAAGLAAHNFAHDYDKAFADAGALVLSRQEFASERNTQWLLGRRDGSVPRSD